MKRKGILIIISGFSGAGKGTLVKRLVEKYDGYALSISATTREPRPGEVDGREYFFLKKEEFERKIAESGLIEYACYCDIITGHRGNTWRSSWRTAGTLSWRLRFREPIR